MRLSPRFCPSRPYERFHRQYGHMRRAYQVFQKYLITKPKPYNVTYPDIGNPSAREAAKGRDFLDNYGNAENFKRG